MTDFPLANYQSESLVNNLPVACWFKGLNLRYQWANDLWRDYLNLDESPIDQADQELLPHWLAEQMLSADLQVLANNQHQEQRLNLDIGVNQHRYLVCQRQPIFDNNGELQGILGFAFDDTDAETNRRKMHQQNTSQANWLHALKHHALISTMNRRGQLTYISERFARLVGHISTDMINQPRRNFPMLPESSSLRYYLTLAEQGEAVSFEFSGQRPDGKRYWVRSLLIALNAPSDTEQVFLELATNMTRQKLAQEQLEEANGSLVRAINENTELIAKLEITARTDSLTGLANRRALFERAEEEIGRCARSQQELALVMLDIDHFKQINDQYGHEAGDHALVKLSQWGSEQLRGHDLFARTGGEEFVLLLPETNHEQALHVSERLRRCIEEKTVTLSHGTTINFTASFGVARFTDGESLEACMSRADKALYVAKGQGRNCVISAETETIKNPPSL